MEAHHEVLITVSSQYIEFFTAFLILLMTATALGFYYFWSSERYDLHLSRLWVFLVPFVFEVLGFLGFASIYQSLVTALAGGDVSPYVKNWLKNVPILSLGSSLGASVSLLIAFAVCHASNAHREPELPDGSEGT